MFKSVYSRMLWTYLVIVLVSLIVLGLMVAGMSRKQYVDNRVSEMRRESEEINSIIEEKYFFKEKRMVALNELSVIARKYNAAIWVIDRNGNFLWVMDPQSGSEWHGKEAVNLEGNVSEVLKGYEIRTTGFFGDIFGEKVMTIGRPLVVHGSIEGAVFMHTKMGDMEKSIQVIYNNVLIAALVAVLLAVIVVPLTTRYLIKPLVQMNTLARSYAKGDFSARVSVKSRDEIGQLAKSLNQMAGELHNMEDMRRSFVANVSHELKSPLTSMRGFLQAVLDGSIERKNQDEYLKIVLDETIRLSDLINDLLDLSKIESGKMPLNIARFNINELVRRILITFEGTINEKNLDVDVIFKQDYCFVEADSDRIAQVIRNLLDNSIKFTNWGGKLTIWTYAGKHKVYIAIKDSGIGIAQDDLSCIWDRFYKAEKAHTPGSNGTGLGLSIVKKIIEQHSETIWVTSSLGKGTNFCFTLRRASSK